MMLASSAGRQPSHAGDPAEKRSLASILRDNGPLAVVDAVDIALDICDVLANAHTNGVVHGDLGLHRVRTSWPRLPGQTVDLFALEENDSAAFAFRASAVAILVAPEQRFGRKVDIRADVWAVGAILHWMITGIPPGTGPVEQTLSNAPRTLGVTIEACLSEDPERRPQSVDEIAEVIGSFASAPAERFEQLARRRAMFAHPIANSGRHELRDVDRALERLDDAALDRELALASEPPPRVSATAAPIERLMIAVQKGTGSAVFDSGPGARPMSDLDEDDDAATRLASPRYVPDVDEVPRLRSSLHHAGDLGVVPAPLSTTPVVVSPLLLTAPSPTTAPLVHPHHHRPPHHHEAARPSAWPTVLGLVGALAAVALGVGIGLRLMATPAAPHSAPAARAVVAATPEVTSTRATAATTTSPPATAKPASVITPASLPDARTTPASLPDAPAMIAPTHAFASPPTATTPRTVPTAGAHAASPMTLPDAR